MRIVALGASNLTRGLPSLVAAARERWGRDVEVVAALGLGRSYGAPSRILVRTRLNSRYRYERSRGVEINARG